MAFSSSSSETKAIKTKSSPEFFCGGSDFSVAIRKGHRLVDKSLLIKDIIDDVTKVKVITRPRGTGKTLNLTMLKYFFEKPQASEENNEDLFHSLQIWQCGEEYRQHQGKYPVIFFKFSFYSLSFDQCVEEIQIELSNQFMKYKRLLFSTILKDDKEEQDFYQKIINKKGSSIETRASLSYLVDLLSKVHKQPVILLIDDYDTPFHYCSNLSELSDYLYPLFATVLKNEHLHQAIVLGVIPEKKLLSSLKEMNILMRIYSVLSEKYSTYFGFTEAEVQRLFDSDDKSEFYKQIKKTYSSYMGGNIMFNSSNIRNCFIDHSRNSDSNIIKMYTLLLTEEEYAIALFPNILKKLFLQNKIYFSHDELFVITEKMDETIEIENYLSNQKEYLSYLLHLGYLTCSSRSLYDECLLEPSNRAFTYKIMDEQTIRQMHHISEALHPTFVTSHGLFSLPDYRLPKEVIPVIFSYLGNESGRKYWK